ncbi:unnamed protein product [Parnassius apollo]|uniref:(apollo) hypothetical protein n=1 Tax=Parnassius apollo TaxID=110799 RepID=A0A8S3X381_PARAO|nr:unnamed protein product [Parnassius apollo]
MYYIILLSVSVIMTEALPLEEYLGNNTDKFKEPQDFERDLEFVSYVENFKQLMAAYVNSEYKYLTTSEKERVNTILEDFFHNLSKDLKEVITLQNENNVNHGGFKEIIKDGESDEIFEKIEQKVISELPDVNDETSNEIVNKLRKNLLLTRQQLDQVIDESKKRQLENS